MRSDKAIKAEIDKLKVLKPDVPQHTAFGEDNHAAIDAEILVLEKALEGEIGNDEQEIWDLDEEQGWSDRERENAIEAFEWLTGDKPMLADDPDGWAGLVKARKAKS